MTAAAKQAFEDMQKMIQAKRKRLNNPLYYDNFVVGSSHLNTTETRKLNKLLNIN